MNERIQELLKQAAPRPACAGDWYSMSPKMVEKFAELIVAECANVCRDDGRWFQEQDDKVEAGVAYALCYKIKQHFGVSE